MPKNVIYEAVTERLDILDKDGQVDKELMPDLSEEQIYSLYSWMTYMRQLDIKTLKLQRQGRMGTYGSIQGQEGAQAGLGLSLNKEDWLVPSFREQLVMMMHGMPSHLILSYWNGDERGCHSPEGVNCLPISIPVASQHLHGVGIGLALKRQGKNAAAVSFGGDGSSSQGDFHEALNFAGVWKTNTVIFIQNNQWAISTPFRNQTAANSIAQKAHGYNIPGIQFDGQDVFASYVASKEALERARSGGGPTLLEALMYRFGDHTTADDASRYRTEKDVERWKESDPILRLKRFMERESMWNDEKEEALMNENLLKIDKDIEMLETTPKADPTEMFDYMYETLPQNLAEQRRALESEINQ